MAPFFSVVVPTFNRAKLIEQTLASVLAQSFQEFEIIIVDDCSPDIDELESVIEHLADDRIRLIKHEVNKNGAAARNTGIKAAEGQFIAFLDSDDTWPATRLATYKKIILANDNSSNSIFYGQVDFKFPQDSSGKVMPIEGISNASVGDYLFIQGGLIQTSTIVCKKTIALATLFDERFVRHQDYDFCLRAQKMGYHFHFVPEVTSNWLRHKGANVVAKGANVDFCLFWLKEMTPYLSIKAKSAYRVKVLMPIAFECGRWKLALEILLASIFRVSPELYLKSVYKGFKSIIKFFLANIK